MAKEFLFSLVKKKRLLRAFVGESKYFLSYLSVKEKEASSEAYNLK